MLGWLRICAHLISVKGILIVILCGVREIASYVDTKENENHSDYDDDPYKDDDNIDKRGRCVTISRVRDVDGSILG